MTNLPRHPKTIAKPSAKRPTKKAESYLELKSAVLMLSIIGTMAGWLVLLNHNVRASETAAQVSAQQPTLPLTQSPDFQPMVANADLAEWEAQNPQPVRVNAAAGLNASEGEVSEGEGSDVTKQSVDISQLRQVNELPSVDSMLTEPVRVVARTQSSR